MKISISISLPDDFRRDDFFAFHQRDKQQVAETWEGDTLHKGIVWLALPARLSFSFSPNPQLKVTLDIDSERKRIEKIPTEIALHNLVNHMLGLNQSTAAFEDFALQHPELKSIISHRRGLRVPQAASPFEALTWAITGQQISLGAAVSLRRKLILYLGVKHSSGLLCYPDAEHIAQLSETDLRNCSYSAAKARTLINVAKQAQSGGLPLTEWLDDFFKTGNFCAEKIYDQLIQVQGIGPWTVDYTLLRGFGWLDGSLHGDVVVRRRLQRFLMEQQKHQGEKISEHETKKWLASFTPWRALVAAHLWAMDN